jgi:hypothetical protein
MSIRRVRQAAAFADLVNGLVAGIVLGFIGLWLVMT